MTQIGSSSLRLALIIPWFGEDLHGGAESQAFQIAVRLAERGHQVEVLTTCCENFFADWSVNHLPPGESRIGKLVVRRFPVDGRNRRLFDSLNGKLLAIPKDQLVPGVSCASEAESDTFAKHNIVSSKLNDYLKDSLTAYDHFLFLPYLYGPMLQGLPLVAERAVLQPCLHDEAYAYLPGVERLFRLSAGLFFNSSGEAKLARQLYGPSIIEKSRLIGEGIEVEAQQASQVLPFGLVEGEFFLFLGRRAREKGIELVIEAFREFRRRFPLATQKLVLAGPGEQSYADEQNDILDVGLVTGGDKVAMLAKSKALVLPSTNESFSRVMMESWRCGRPVLAHSECLATATAALESGGGLTANSVDEWANALGELALMAQDNLAALGQRGQVYAAVQADWNAVMKRYEDAFRELAARRESRATRIAVTAPRRFVQLLPNLTYGDAISNEAMHLADQARTQGFEALILCNSLDGRLADHGQRYVDGMVRPDDALLYHHSIGTHLTTLAKYHPGPKVLVYHNVTPDHFFTDFNPGFARLLQAGREELLDLARYFPKSVGVSQYNCDELRDFGFREPMRLPLCIDPNIWQARPDADVMRRLGDGRPTVLFVGRISPNKRQDELVKLAWHLRALIPDVRVALVGGYAEHDAYATYVRGLVHDLDLSATVELSGGVSHEALQAYFRRSQLFVSLSEHEGFGVPLIEAMWFDLPVLAKQSSAVGETLGDAALLVSEDTPLGLTASLCARLLQDKTLRETLLHAQRQRRRDFLPEAVAAYHSQLWRSLELA